MPGGGGPKAVGYFHIVAIYLLTNRSSQNLLIKHDLPQPPEPIDNTFILLITATDRELLPLPFTLGDAFDFRRSDIICGFFYCHFITGV